MNEKWKVHKIKTDCEPWLFLDGWEKDIIETIEFDHKKKRLSIIQGLFMNIKRVIATFI